MYNENLNELKLCSAIREGGYPANTRTSGEFSQEGGGALKFLLDDFELAAKLAKHKKKLEDAMLRIQKLAGNGKKNVSMKRGLRTAAPAKSGR